MLIFNSITHCIAPQKSQSKPKLNTQSQSTTPHKPTPENIIKLKSSQTSISDVYKERNGPQHYQQRPPPGRPRRVGRQSWSKEGYPHTTGSHHPPPPPPHPESPPFPPKRQPGPANGDHKVTEAGRGADLAGASARKGRGKEREMRGGS